MLSMFRSTLLIFAVVIALPGPVSADPTPLMDCFEQASERYRIDLNLLLAIAKVESEFDMSATNTNKNGTTDYGVMMINSHWKPKLADLGVDWKEVTESECLNIHIGAWVLANNFAKAGINWYAVGAYNAGFGKAEKTRRNRLIYASKVYRALQSIGENVSVLRTESAIPDQTTEKTFAAGNSSALYGPALLLETGH